MNEVLPLAGCVIWMPIAVMVISVIHWMIAGELDAISGLFGIGVAAALGYVAFKPPAPIFSPIALVIAISTIVLYPFLRAAMNARDLKSLEVEQLERAYQALTFRPRDPIGRFRVARQLYELGFPGHAFKIAESALKELPERLFIDEHRTFRQWQYVVTDPRMFAPIRCLDCGEPNAPGRIHCEKCGSPFLLERARGKFIGRGQGKKILAAWTCAVAVLLVIPLATAVPPLVAIGVTLVAAAIAGGTVYLAFRKESPGEPA